MIGTLDVIDRLPFELQARLEADEFFVDVPVVVMEAGNIKLELDRKQAALTAKGGKRGVAVIVLQVVADDEYANVAFGPMTLRPAFQVVEFVEMNRDSSGTQKSARRVARRIRDVIKPLMLWGLTTEFIPDNPCIAPVTLAEELGKSVVAYQVNFLTYEADTEPMGQVVTPQFVPNNDGTRTFRIECGTAGATVYYTVDESFPGPSSSTTAQIYDAGVGIEIPAGGVTVRAAGYKAGMIGSQVNRALITAG